MLKWEFQVTVNTKVDDKDFEKVGRFICDADTSTAVAKEMLLYFIKCVGQIEDQELAKIAEKKASEPKGEGDVVQGTDNVGSPPQC